jgi:hypothetical protein
MDSKLEAAAADQFSRIVWCSECHLRIAPYDLRSVWNGQDYHRHCFHRMVHKQPELVPQEAPSNDED